MSSQTEDRNQLTEQSLPASDAGARKGSRKSWLALVITVVVVAALLGSGIWSRVKARTTLKAETAQVALTHSQTIREIANARRIERARGDLT